MDIIELLLIILSIFLILKYRLYIQENYETINDPDNSEIKFAHQFQQLPLPSSDELSEIGGGYQEVTGIF
jgi:hypothetical protein